MKTENYRRLEEIIKEVEQFRDDIYDYDYDDNTIWYLNEAIRNLKEI